MVFPDFYSIDYKYFEIPLNYIPIIDIYNINSTPIKIFNTQTGLPFSQIPYNVNFLTDKSVKITINKNPLSYLFLRTKMNPYSINKYTTMKYISDNIVKYY